MWVGKQKWKQRERDREGKQVNANRKQELALINRKVSTDSKKCVTFHDFSLGTFEDSLYILAQNIRNNYIPYEEYEVPWISALCGYWFLCHCNRFTDNANYQPKLHSFEMLPSKSLICTSVSGKLWSTGAFRDSGAGARLGNFWKKWVRMRQDSAIKKLLKIFLQYMFNILLSILLVFHII